jgi:hypothetical protein
MRLLAEEWTLCINKAETEVPPDGLAAVRFTY